MTAARSRPAAVLVSTASGVAIWALAQALPGAAPHVPSGDGGSQSLGITPVVVTGVVVGLAGWVALAVLEHFVASPRSWWTRLAAVALALSMVALASPGLTAVDRAWLLLLHVGVGGVLILLLRQSARPRVLAAPEALQGVR